MTEATLSSIQYYLVFAMVWGEAILLALVFYRYVVKQISRQWIVLALIVILLVVIFFAGFSAIAHLLEVINPSHRLPFPNDIQSTEDIAIYIAAQMTERLKNYNPSLFGGLTAAGIWLASLVIIFFKKPIKGKQL